jgi:hypothetical protein
MTDIRSLAAEFKKKPVVFFYKLEKKRTGGYNVALTWRFDALDFPDVVLFKIYRTNLGRPKLRKDYLITQKALERTTSNKLFSQSSNQLYNKSLFSQNSKLKFENSNSTQHDKVERDISEYEYVSIATVPTKKSNVTYVYRDKNVKFGESYLYYVSAVTRNLAESVPSPVLVNVENLRHPDKPDYLHVEEADRGLLLIASNKTDRTIDKFKIFKREDSEKEFQLIATIDRDETIHYLDSNVMPKKNYIYRVYSEDVFGTLSLASAEASGVFRYVPFSTNIEYQPSIEIKSDQFNGVDFSIKNNRSDKVESVRIERRDDWRFEKAFSSKYFLSSDNWPRNIFFNSSGTAKFLDNTVPRGAAVSYRISAFSKSGLPISYFLTPPMILGEQIKLINNQFALLESPTLNSFDVDVTSDKQMEVFVKFSWKISGDWSHVFIVANERRIRVDNFHKDSVFIGGFLDSKTYSVGIEVYGMDGVKYAQRGDVLINI